MVHRVVRQGSASAIMVCLLWATAAGQGTASTQPGTGAPPKPPANPGALKQAVLPGLPPGTIVRQQMATEPGPYLKLVRPRDWVAKTNLLISDRDYGVISNRDATVEGSNYNFETYSFYFPVVGQSGNSQMKSVESSTIDLGPDESYITAEFKNDAVTSRNGKPTFNVIKEIRPGIPMPSGAWLTRWNVEVPGRLNRFKFEIKTVTTCSDTELDWDAAGKVAWPTSGWPLQAAAALQSQLFVDYVTDPKTGEPVPFDLTGMKKMIDKLTSGNPKGATPLVLARVIAAEILPKFSISGDVYKRGPETNKQITGFRVQRVDEVMKSMRGSEADLSILLVAMYRAAGLPARLVVGVQTEEDNKLPDRKGGEDKPRVWLEFCLYDEPKNTVTWIPVDPMRMKKRSSAVPPLNKPWPFFGDHSEMQNMVPLAFQLLPASVNAMSYGDPALWGWSMTPQPPAANFTRMTIQTEQAPRSSRDIQDPQVKDPRKPKTPGRTP